MEEKRAIRHYVRGFKRGFEKTVNSLSFMLQNLADAEAHDCINSLTKVLPEGKVTVTRVGAMCGELQGAELVTIIPNEGVMQIILSSDKKETYGIPLLVTKKRCVIDHHKSKTTFTPRKFAFPVGIATAEFFEETFVAEDWDMYSEICPFIYTWNHINFIIVVRGTPDTYQPIIKPRDDWHFNNYYNFPDIQAGQHGLSYYEASARNISDVHVAFSFSPYTYMAALYHLGRYIDQAKRLYIPMLGREEEFEHHPKIVVISTQFPYGKKPFTRTEDGIIRWREVIMPTGDVPLPNLLEFNLTLFWPFTPYLREMAYANLQFINGYPMLLSLANMEPCHTYELHYRTAEGDFSEESREDELEGEFPETESSSYFDSDINPAVEIVSGKSVWNESQSRTVTYSVKKSASIGTVGERKDLFVSTELSGALVLDYWVEGELTREADFPGRYYLPEFVDTMFWPCCPYYDTTAAWENSNKTWTNQISGHQRLMVGGTEIDKGDILMSYQGVETQEITHEGSASRNVTGPPHHIGYTTLQMNCDESQEIRCLDANGEQLDCNFADGGLVLEGGGTLSKGYGNIYTAPSDNQGCRHNAEIVMYLCEKEIDRIKIAVNCYDDPAIVAYYEPGGWYCASSFGWYWMQDVHKFNCAMEEVGITVNACGGCWSTGYCNAPPALDTCATAFPNGCTSCGNHGGINILCSGVTDVRSEAMKEAACCPAPCCYPK